MFANVAYGGVSNYVTFAPAAFALRVASAGTTTAVASALAPPGEAAVPAQNLTAIGGSGQPGSAITAFVFPRSVAGSLAPQSAAFQSPAVVYVVDKHPR